MPLLAEGNPGNFLYAHVSGLRAVIEGTLRTAEFVKNGSEWSNRKGESERQ